MQAQARFQSRDFEVTPSSANVLEAWEAVHHAHRELANKDTPEVRQALVRNLKHLDAHTKVIERLLRPRR